MTHAELVTLTATLADTCRAKGIDAVKVSVDGTIELRMGAPPAKPERELSTEEREERTKREAHEARRLAYAKQFGRKPSSVTDEELAGLP